MESRIDGVWSKLEETIDQRGVEDILKTAYLFRDNRTEVLENLHRALFSCDEQAIALQGDGKGETSFIVFSFLESSFLTGSHDIQIDFCDASFLADFYEASAHFSYEHLIPAFKESVASICEEVQKSLYRFTEYERDDIALRYKSYVLYKMVMTTCSLALMDEETLPIWEQLSLAKPCQMTFGHLNNNQQVYMTVPQKLGGEAE